MPFNFDLLNLGNAELVDVSQGDAPRDDTQDILADILIMCEYFHEGVVQHSDVALIFEERGLFVGGDVGSFDADGKEVVILPPGRSEVPTILKLLL